MLQNFIDDLKHGTGVALRTTSLTVAIAISLFVTSSFLCAAAFVWVFQGIGLVPACLTGASVFLVLTLITACCHLYEKRRSKSRSRPKLRNPLSPLR